MSKDDAPEAPNYAPLIAAATAQSEKEFQLGQQQLQWAKDQYAQDQKTIQPLVSAQTANATAAANFAKTQNDLYQSTYVPAYKSFVDTANNYDTPEAEQLAAGRAAAGVAQQYDQARTAAEGELQSYGIDPSSGRYAGINMGARTQGAAAEAGAGQQAIDTTKATGLGLKQAAIAAGAGLSGSVLGGLSTSTGSAGSAISGTNQSTATGASTMGTGTQWAGASNAGLSTAGSLTAQQYADQMSQYKANQASSSGWGSLLGTIGGFGTGGGTTIGGSLFSAFLSDGGEVGAIRVPHAADGGPMAAPVTSGPTVPPQASPSGGAETDDVPARLNVGEFVIPKDVVSWMGEKKLQDLIGASRKQKGQAIATPDVKSAPNAPPAFVSPGAQPAAIPMR